MRDMSRYQAMGDKLRSAREEHGLSRPRVERRLHLGKGTLKYWEHGTHRINVGALVKLADYYELPIDYFTDSLRED